MSAPQSEPLLSLHNVSRVYASGASEVRALDHVTVDIHAGEFVAIMGQSGSGKSTLMNILGCLDRPTHGHYRVRGVDVATLDIDQLAVLRRNLFGFVFQRYNLLNGITAAENVELPAIYAGRRKRERQARAHALLGQLGLGERAGHRPSQLSGGQQQRVSIARAMMNGAQIILADEPTGALDSRSGEDVLRLLADLHAQGRTIILITHDADVAAHAQRVIHILDGRVVSDSGTDDAIVARPPDDVPAVHQPDGIADLAEAVKMAMRSLRANLFRSALTLLGVVIGVAAVVTMLAIGNGSKQEVIARIQSMGTNLLLVFPGAPGARGGVDRTTLTTEDALALTDLPSVTTVSPERRERSTLRIGNVDYQTNVNGAWPGYMAIQDWRMASGSFITDDDVRRYSSVIVLGKTVVDNLFPDGSDPIGRFVLAGNVPFEVIGVLQPKGANAYGADMDNMAIVPLSTGLTRLFGGQHISMINVKIASAVQADAIEAAIVALLKSRHGREDFQVRSTTSRMEAAASTQDTLTLLLGAVAAISLLVGGIGVMNIMLVNVTERTREIGVRMATGARAGNILLQFNTEAMVVCGIGGLIGVILGLAAGVLAQALGSKVVFTATPAIVAFTSAFLTGVVFGYLPARKAAHMDPVAALASE